MSHAKKISAKAFLCPISPVDLRAGSPTEHGSIAAPDLPPTTRLTGRGWLLLAASVLVAFLGVVGYLVWDNDREWKRSKYGDAVAAPQASAGEITKMNFNRLQTGMSYPEVVGILGRAGEELSRVELAGTVTVMYGWKKPLSMGNMNATFQKGKLVSKAQFGL